MKPDFQTLGPEPHGVGRRLVLSDDAKAARVLTVVRRGESDDVSDRQALAFHQLPGHEDLGHG